MKSFFFVVDLKRETQEGVLHYGVVMGIICDYYCCFAASRASSLPEVKDWGIIQKENKQNSIIHQRFKYGVIEFLLSSSIRSSLQIRVRSRPAQFVQISLPGNDHIYTNLIISSTESPTFSSGSRINPSNSNIPRPPKLYHNHHARIGFLLMPR